MCRTNTISIPANVQTNTASEINLNPIVNHHIIKNGLNTLNKIPVIVGLLSSLDFENPFFSNIDLNCSVPKIKSVIAPKIDIIVLNSGNISNENTPIPSKITNGNSTIVCPTAILIPVFVYPCVPDETFVTKSGPGIITPDAEIIITRTANSINSHILYPNVLPILK